jgi:hypothetical protein
MTGAEAAFEDPRSPRTYAVVFDAADVPKPKKPVEFTSVRVLSVLAFALTVA